MTRRRPIGTPRSAEVAAVRIVRGVHRAAWAAILEAVRATWPHTTTEDVRRAIVRSLRREATIAALRRVALHVRGSVHRQVAAIVPELGRWRPKDDEPGAEGDAADAYAAIVAMLLGARADDVRVDGSPTPTLNRVMARLRAKRATDAEIADVLEDLRATAPAEERAAISRVRGRVLKWGAEKNRKAQIASGIKRYIWRTQRDGRVRPMHAALDGATQRWSKPPIIRSDGTRGNPGDDYNCRCWAEPVVNRESLRIKARAERAERGRR